MSRTIVAITTTFNGKKSFVTSTFPRFAGSIGVELSNDQNKAHDFCLLHHAQDLIPRIHNPFDRAYEAEQLKVLQPLANQIRTQSWLEEKVLK